MAFAVLLQVCVEKFVGNLPGIRREVVLAFGIVGPQRFLSAEKLVDRLRCGHHVAHATDVEVPIANGGTGQERPRGKGADDLYGGSGNDLFVFKALSDSTYSSAGRDSIFDFNGNGDRINLSAIDANTKVTGNQAFKFIGTDSFHGKAGELRFIKKASDTYIQGDVNGDKKADLAIHLDDRLALDKYDFIL